MMIHKTFSQAIKYLDSNKWINAMKYEMTSMKVNQVWELVELPNGFTLIQCK